MYIEILSSGSKGNAYKIIMGETAFLIECGLPIKTLQKSLKFSLSDINACLISHEHQDHAKSVKALIKKGIDLYMSEGTAEALDLKSYRVNTFKRISNSYYQEFRIKNLIILPFPLIHDAKEPTGFLIKDKEEKLLFITDSAYSPFKFSGITHLMIECNYVKETMDKNFREYKININLRNRIVRNHMSLESLITFLKANDLKNLKKIYLLHLSKNNSDEERIRDEITKLTGKETVIC